MRIYVADIPVDNVDKKEALSKIESFLKTDSPHFAVAINPEKIIKAYKDCELKEILKKGDLNFVDGIGVIWCAKIFYKERFKKRVPGIDLFLDLLKLASEKKYSVFLLGSTENAIQNAVKSLQNSFPELKIAGYHNGYFKNEKEVVQTIAKSNADILFVGMGSPKQEKFIFRNLKNLNVKFAMGVGGSFNVLSGEFKRAPALIQNLGLEWLYRFLLDPKRLPRILSLPKFVLLVMRVPQKIENEVDFFGIKISNRPKKENIAIVESFVKDREKTHLVVTLNGEMTSKAFNDPEFLNILRDADLVIPDGIGIVWGARKFGKRIMYRIPGIEFAWDLLKASEEKNYRVYFLGAKEKVLGKAIEKIRSEFPKLDIAGYHSGYFDKTEESEIIEEINNKNIDILFAGMGGGKQEKWIRRHKELNVPVAIGVGGSFDVWSGKVRRAPRLVQKIGFEWLYRMLIQPARLFRMKHIVLFVIKVLFKKNE